MKGQCRHHIFKGPECNAGEYLQCVYCGFKLSMKFKDRVIVVQVLDKKPGDSGN